MAEIGSVIPWPAAAAPPARWLLCDGTAVSQATYAQLFAVIGAIFNTGGEPPGTFRVPDCRGRMVFGTGTALALAATDGLAEAVRNPRNHAHAGAAVTGAGGADAAPIAHGGVVWTDPDFSSVQLTGGGTAFTASGHDHLQPPPANHIAGMTVLNHSHNGGATAALNNFPTFLGLPRIIYAGV